MRPKEVSIIIVSYNTRDFIKTCLRALAERTKDVACETIVVDNASRDGSVEMIEKEFPEVNLVKNAANHGYAKAVNQGISRSRGRYFLILNPDIEVAEGSVKNLWTFMEGNARVGIAGARLLYPDGSLQMSCRTFYTLPTMLLRRTFLGKVFPNAKIVREHLMLDWDHNSEREVDWILGACMMVRREAYESLGGMDERFFLYLEDVDWCFRMKKHGWRVYYVPQAVMTHYHRRESARFLPDRKLLSHLFSTFRFYDKWNSAIFAMKRERWIFWLLGTILADVILINLAFVSAYYTRYAFRGLLTKPLYGLGIYKGLIVFVNVVCLLSLVYSGFYRKRRPTTSVRDLVGISRAMLLSSLVIMAATFLTRTITYSRTIILIFWPISTVLVTLGRAVARGVHHGLRRSFFDLRRIAIVGEDEDAIDLRARLVTSRGSECDFVGYIAPAGRDVRPDMRPLVGDTRSTGNVVIEHRINEVFVCDKRLSRAEIGPVIVAARRAGAEVKVVSEVTDILIHGSQLEEIGGIPVVVFPPASLSGVRLLTKRASDFFFSLIGIALLVAVSPLALVSQTLTYRNYTPWTDSLRGLGLVLYGKMSLAGPGQCISGERLKPGVIGPWLGAEGLTGEERDRLDIYYVQNWSLSYDLEIMLESLKRLGNLFRNSIETRK